MKNPSTRFRKGKRDVNARNGLVMIFVCTKFSVRVRACSQCCVAFISVSICHALRKRTPFSAWWVLQEGIGEKRWTGTPKHLFLSCQYKRILNAMNETNIPFHGSVQTSQVAKTLRNIMRPNPAKARPKKKVNVLLWLMWVMMIFNLSHTGLLVAMLPMLLKVPWTLTVTSALPHIFSFSPIIVSRQWVVCRCCCASLARTRGGLKSTPRGRIVVISTLQIRGWKYEEYTYVFVHIYIAFHTSLLG